MLTVGRPYIRHFSIILNRYIIFNPLNNFGIDEAPKERHQKHRVKPCAEKHRNNPIALKERQQNYCMSNEVPMPR